MSRPERMREAWRLLEALKLAGYRLAVVSDGLAIDRPADMPAKRALSFRLAISEYKAELLALLMQEQAP